MPGFKHKQNILIIEDEQDQVELIQFVFAQDAQWATLRVANSLAEADAHLRTITPNLVISDLRLPDGDGVQFLQNHAASRLPNGSATSSCVQSFPIVIMTGYGDQQAAVEAMKAGALDYVVKDGEALINLPRVAERALREWNSMVKREQAEEALRIHLAKTELLYDTAQSLSAVDGLTKKLQTLVNNAAEALPARLVALYTLDLANREVSETVVSGLNVEPFTAPSFNELWESLAGWTLRTLEPALSSGKRADSRESTAAQLKREQMGIGAMVVAPLAYRGRTLGILAAMNRSGERDFTDRHRDLIMALANQAAGAVENARLFSETTRLLNQMRKRATQIQQIIDTVPDGVLLLDNRHRIVQENAASKDYLEIIPCRRVGQILTHIGDHAIAELLTLPPNEEQNMLLVESEGEERFEISARPTRASATQLLAGGRSLMSRPADNSDWVVVIRDVTHRMTSRVVEANAASKNSSTIARMARAIWH